MCSRHGICRQSCVVRRCQAPCFRGAQARILTKAAITHASCLLQVLPAAQWAQSNLSAYQGRDASLRGQMDAKRGELGAYRSQQLAAALAPAPTGAAAVAAKVEQLSLI